MAGARTIRTLLGSALAAGPTETVFWSGAGISADAPTSGPVGNALADRALNHAFAPGTGAKIADYYARLRLGRQRPRLETLLDVVFRIHGESVLDDLLSDLATASPNALHGFFAEHLAAGGRHITANFDTCIERSAGPGTAPHVVHFHGSFAAPPLGATLARIERGFPADVRTELERLLTDANTRLIVFVGYSGLDFFDVDPFLRDLPAGSLARRTVIWVNHANTPPTVATDVRKQLGWLNRAGASTVEINALTRDVLDELGDRWGFVLTDPPGSASPWQPRVAVSAAIKERATLELYALMNLHREVHARVRRPTHADEWELLAAALWAEGRYSDAGAAWAHARAAASDAARRERRAAVLWIRGQFRRARRELLEALSDTSISLEERLILAELLARVLTHMRRFPDSRLIPVGRARRRALAELPDPATLGASGTPLGTHLRVRVASARAAVGASSADNPEAVERFGEYEALGAQLNYRHAALRQRLAREHVDPRELHELRAAFEAIGATGDAARATLLGGVGVFGWRQVLRAATSLDVTGWHRARLLTMTAVVSARRWFRVARPPAIPLDGGLGSGGGR